MMVTARLTAGEHFSRNLQKHNLAPGDFVISTVSGLGASPPTQETYRLLLCLSHRVPSETVPIYTMFILTKNAPDSLTISEKKPGVPSPPIERCQIHLQDRKAFFNDEEVCCTFVENNIFPLLNAASKPSTARLYFPAPLPPTPPSRQDLTPRQTKSRTLPLSLRAIAFPIAFPAHALPSQWGAPPPLGHTPLVIPLLPYSFSGPPQLPIPAQAAPSALPYSTLPPAPSPLKPLQGKGKRMGQGKRQGFDNLSPQAAYQQICKQFTPINSLRAGFEFIKTLFLVSVPADSDLSQLFSQARMTKNEHGEPIARRIVAHNGEWSVRLLGGDFKPCNSELCAALELAYIHWDGISPSIQIRDAVYLDCRQMMITSDPLALAGVPVIRRGVILYESSRKARINGELVGTGVTIQITSSTASGPKTYSKIAGRGCGDFVPHAFQLASQDPLPEEFLTALKARYPDPTVHPQIDRVLPMIRHLNRQQTDQFFAAFEIADVSPDAMDTSEEEETPPHKRINGWLLSRIESVLPVGNAVVSEALQRRLAPPLIECDSDHDSDHESDASAASAETPKRCLLFHGTSMMHAMDVIASKEGVLNPGIRQAHSDSVPEVYVSPEIGIAYHYALEASVKTSSGRPSTIILNAEQVGDQGYNSVMSTRLGIKIGDLVTETANHRYYTLTESAIRATPPLGTIVWRPLGDG